MAIFVGFLGIHRMVLGYTRTGIAMLVLSLIVVGLPVTVVWALVDIVLIALGKLEEQ